MKRASFQLDRLISLRYASHGRRLFIPHAHPTPAIGIRHPPPKERLLIFSTGGA